MVLDRESDLHLRFAFVFVSIRPPEVTSAVATSPTPSRRQIPTRGNDPADLVCVASPRTQRKILERKAPLAIADQVKMMLGGGEHLVGDGFAHIRIG